jgi:hypothetical protein
MLQRPPHTVAKRVVRDGFIRGAVFFADEELKLRRALHHTHILRESRPPSVDWNDPISVWGLSWHITRRKIRKRKKVFLLHTSTIVVMFQMVCRTPPKLCEGMCWSLRIWTFRACQYVTSSASAAFSLAVQSRSRITPAMLENVSSPTCGAVLLTRLVTAAMVSFRDGNCNRVHPIAITINVILKSSIDSR